MNRIHVRLVASLVAALLLSAGVLVGPHRAAACACGAVISEAKVSGEVSILAWDGKRQSIDMSMMLDRSTKNAGWIMPTPTVADITLGSSDDISVLARASAPRVEVKKVFRPLDHFFGVGSDGTGAEPRSTGAQVLRTAEVGPFTVTTLTGTDAGAVNDWLSSNDYPSRDDLVPAFQTYLDQGWVLQAVKLTARTGGTAFQEALPPLRMTFATAQPVYPILLSAQASIEQNLRLYVLAAGPMTVSQDASEHNPLNLVFSGKIPSDQLDNRLVPGDMVHLTAYEAFYYDPADISHDITFAADPQLSDYQQVHTIYQNTAGGLVGLLVVVLLLVAPVAVILLIARRIMRTARPPA